MALPQDLAAEDITGEYRTGPWLFTTTLFDVYSGTDLGLGREVHLRILKPRFARSEALARALIGAAKNAAALLHPNLVHVYDVGQMAGRLTVVTEAAERLADVDGSDLRRVTDQLLAGLHAAHGAGLLHGAIDDGAMFLAADGTAKLADVGLFPAAASAEPRLAPRPPSVETDLCALAALVLKRSTGHDRGIEAVLMRALSADPTERFASARDMGAALLHAPEPDEPEIPKVPTEPTASMNLPGPPRVANRALTAIRALAPGLIALALIGAALSLAWSDTDDHPLPGRPTTHIETDLPPEIPR